MEDKMKMLLLFYVCSTFSLAFAAVPVIIWGGANVKQVNTPAGQTVSKGDLQTVLGALPQNHDLLVFLQDKLSLEDITNNADVYKTNSNGAMYHNLKTLMQEYSSTHLPRVSSPADAIAALREKFSGRVHDLRSPYKVGDLSLAGDSGNMIVVHLPQTSEETGTNLATADDVIGSVSTEFKNLGRLYNAIYTGKETSKVKPQSLYFGRHLLAVENNKTSHFYNISGCIFFYADKMILTLASNDKAANNTIVLKPTDDTAGSTCSNGTTSLQLHFTDQDFKQLDMTINYTKTRSGFWQTTAWTMTYQRKTATEASTAYFPVYEIFAPLTFSYHCTDPKLKNGTTTSLKVTNFQTQAFVFKKDQFGRANDCVGLFTIPIWSGIIAGFVLISILTFGLSLLANINSMDRFDDPKGKTISVNVGE